ncbi:molybdenum cofactor biosynthesis protein C-like [Tropilaelaps mercedesae]|uniref:cyclic pyranopterin monophosphate synthase n=1 Tax=Tropilaelaps mercedesae TaxID=418985 RepID=A0A1V9XUG0_9ACAR|nr:molybdenum cofactor biosynthesis protein C-like [Tropilaelaps mercedesae]
MNCANGASGIFPLLHSIGRMSLCSSSALTHLDSTGRTSQVDVSAKATTVRRAIAACRVTLPRNVFDLLKENKLKKGDALNTARVAGIQASKQTALLIPLCHQINLERTTVELILDEQKSCVKITSTVACTGKTGVEMEALTACSVAALCIYDMCKAASYDIRVEDLRLLAKTGGRSNFHRADKDDI